MIWNFFPSFSLLYLTAFSLIAVTTLCLGEGAILRSCFTQKKAEPADAKSEEGKAANIAKATYISGIYQVPSSASSPMVPPRRTQESMTPEGRWIAPFISNFANEFPEIEQPPKPKTTFNGQPIPLDSESQPADSALDNLLKIYDSNPQAAGPSTLND